MVPISRPEKEKPNKTARCARLLMVSISSAIEIPIARQTEEEPEREARLKRNLARSTASSSRAAAAATRHKARAAKQQPPATASPGMKTKLVCGAVGRPRQLIKGSVDTH